jgi:hypothetical protein
MMAPSGDTLLVAILVKLQPRIGSDQLGGCAKINGTILSCIRVDMNALNIRDT